MTNEDIGTKLHYDEQVALETNVLRNYKHLLTDEERVILDGGLEHWWDQNLERMHEWGAHMRSSTVALPWVPEPVDQVHAATVRAIVQRLQKDHAGEIRIVRCSKCDRIVRGPSDTHCPWCRASLGATA
jgi:hypothetical protein